MSNRELKKLIQNAIAKLDNYRIELAMWHCSDGIWGDVVYNSLTIFNSLDGYCSIFDIQYGIEASEEEAHLVISEQNKMKEYLNKHFRNVIIKELNV